MLTLSLVSPLSLSLYLSPLSLSLLYLSLSLSLSSLSISLCLSLSLSLSLCLSLSLYLSLSLFFWLARLLEGFSGVLCGRFLEGVLQGSLLGALQKALRGRARQPCIWTKCAPYLVSMAKTCNVSLWMKGSYLCSKSRWQNFGKCRREMFRELNKAYKSSGTFFGIFRMFGAVFAFGNQEPRTCRGKSVQQRCHSIA